MDLLFKNNGLKNKLLLAGLAILLILSATFIVNALILLLPVGIIGWTLYSAFKYIKGFLANSRRGKVSQVYKADIVSEDSIFKDSISNKKVIDVEFTEV